MNLSSSQKRKNELISIKPLKKSIYLENLEKQRYEGLKSIEKQKAGILIDKILIKEKFKRDYTIFSNHKFHEKEKFSTIENRTIKNNKILSLNKTNKNNKNSIIKYHQNNKSLNKMTKETFITRNLDRNNFLSIIGDDIINSKYLLKK